MHWMVFSSLQTINKIKINKNKILLGVLFGEKRLFETLIKQRFCFFLFFLNKI